MSTTDEGPRRLAVIDARYSAERGAPPGIDAAAFAAACLADSYEVLADLVGVASGIIGPPAAKALLWPGGLLLPELPLLELAAREADDFDELVVVAADVPDLPGLVLAKMFKVLHRVDVTVAPERGGLGCAAIGVALPVAAWVPELDLDQPRQLLADAAPRRDRYAVSPDWHRLRSPVAISRLDPGLEGWEETRALLSGAALPDG